MLVDKFAVDSDRVSVTDDSIVSTYQYQATTVQRGTDGQWVVKPTATEYQFKTDRRVPKLGCVGFVGMPTSCVCVYGRYANSNTHDDAYA